MSGSTAKITSLNGITIGEGCVFSSGNFKNSNNDVITLPSASGTIALTSDITTATAGIVTETGTQTLTNKTLTTPEIASIKNSSATITVPSTTGTLALTSDVTSATAGIVTLTGEQTLSNKTLNNPKIATIVNGGSAITVPSTIGTLALLSDVNTAVNAQKGRIDRLLNYLEKWISVGNLSMADITESVDPSS